MIGPLSSLTGKTTDDNDARNRCYAPLPAAASGVSRAPRSGDPPILDRRWVNQEERWNACGQ